MKFQYEGEEITSGIERGGYNWLVYNIELA